MNLITRCIFHEPNTKDIEKDIYELKILVIDINGDNDKNFIRNFDACYKDIKETHNCIKKLQINMANHSFHLNYQFAIDTIYTIKEIKDYDVIIYLYETEHELECINKFIKSFENINCVKYLIKIKKENKEECIDDDIYDFARKYGNYYCQIQLIYEDVIKIFSSVVEKVILNIIRQSEGITSIAIIPHIIKSFINNKKYKNTIEGLNSIIREKELHNKVIEKELKDLKLKYSLLDSEYIIQSTNNRLFDNLSIELSERDTIIQNQNDQISKQNLENQKLINELENLEIKLVDLNNQLEEKSELLKIKEETINSHRERMKKDYDLIIKLNSEILDTADKLMDLKEENTIYKEALNDLEERIKNLTQEEIEEKFNEMKQKYSNDVNKSILDFADADYF